MANGKAEQSFCKGKNNVPGYRGCRGLVLWKIRGIGYFCQSCFDHYFESHEIDPKFVIRLAAPAALGGRHEANRKFA